MKTCPKCRATYPKHFTVCPHDATPLQSLHELPAGAVVRGKYQILSKLGEGGMGVVYKARHVRFDEIVALKLVSGGLLDDPTFLQRFNAEAMVMRKLDHPHALRVHDIDETEDGNPFIVMEYVEGQPLSDLLRERSAAAGLEPARAIRIVIQACEALAAAHRMGIIHRDIKPSNIMLARDAEGAEQVKVFDFGIAKVKEGPLRSVSLTQTGVIVGTPAYMSPEQCKGLRGDKLDGRSDLYSLGIVLYEALTGRTPFSGRSPTELLLAHLQQAPPDPRTLNAGLPQALVDIVLRALEKDPDKRFANSTEMHSALAAALLSLDAAAGRTIAGTPHSAPSGGDRTGPRTPEPHLASTPTERVVTPPPKSAPETSQPPKPSQEAETQSDVSPLHKRPAEPPTPMRPATSTTAPQFWHSRWVFAVAPALLVVTIIGSLGYWETAKKSAPDTAGTAPPAGMEPVPAQPQPQKMEAPKNIGKSTEEETLFAQANAALDRGQLGQAKRLFSQVAKLDGPRKAEAQKLSSQVDQMLGQVAANEVVEGTMQAGRVAVQRGDYVAARRAIEDIKAMGGDPSALQAEMDTAQRNELAGLNKRFSELRARGDAKGLEALQAETRIFAEATGNAEARTLAENRIPWAIKENEALAAKAQPPRSATPPAPGTVRQNPKDGLNYVWIPPGTFMMGCSPGDTECEGDENPAHQVTITTGFWMGQTEVTVGAFKRFAAATGRQMPSAPRFNSGWTYDNMPVVGVSWHDAQAYCGWAGGRLPTEAEWEYAARAGSTEARYGAIESVAWYSSNSGGQAHGVAQKRANGFGVYDTLGNIWEWVSDWYDQNYYRSSPSEDPSGPPSGQYRVLRGGSWYVSARSVRLSGRDGSNPEGRSDSIGLRCVGGVGNP